MNEFVTFLGRQLAADARSAGPRLRARFSDERVQHCGTIAELRAAARRGVPRVMFDFVDGGAEDEVTLRRNQSDLAELEILPRMLVDVSSVDLATTVLGEPVAVPMLSAPMGLNGLVHHDGELGIARACLAGRPFVYGLGAGGEAGARRAATILTEELRATMGLAGCRSVAVLDRSWVRHRGTTIAAPQPSEGVPFTG